MPRYSTKVEFGVAFVLCAIAGGLFVADDAETDVLRITVRDAVSPGLALVQTARTTLSETARKLEAASDAARENDELRRSRDAWELHCRRLQIANARLHDDLRLARTEATSPYVGEDGKPLFVVELLNGSVLGEETSALWRGGLLVDQGSAAGVALDAPVVDNADLLIDQGETENVAVDQPVYAGRAVLGRVASVGRWTSTIRPVADLGYRGSARIIRDGVPAAEGVIEGSGDGSCVLKYVSSTEAVSVGDEVYDAARDLPHPMYYGRVVEAELATGAPHWRIKVEPAAAANKARTVQILRTTINPTRINAN